MPRNVLPCCVVVALGPPCCRSAVRGKLRCNPDGTPSAESFAAHGEKPSEEEAKQFAGKLEKALSGGSFAEANALIDWDTLFDFASDTAEGSAQFRTGFIKGAKNGIQSPTLLMGQIASQLAQGGTYKFLHCHEQDGQLRVLFRLITTEGGLNYHDMVVLKYPDGVRAADIYVAASGELLSKTMRQMYISALAADKPSFLSKKNDHDADLANNITKLTEMADAIGRTIRARQSAFTPLCLRALKAKRRFCCCASKPRSPSVTTPNIARCWMIFKGISPTILAST